MNITSSDADAGIAIETAELIVDEHLADQSYSTDKLKYIKLWLSAHFFELSWNHGGLVSKQVGDSKEEYNRMSSELGGFNATRYGQQALALDNSGSLATVGVSKQRAEFRVV